MSKQSKFLVILGIICILSFTSFAFAAGKEFVVAKVRVRPTLGLSSEYISNRDLKANDEEGAMVYRVTPGLSLQIPLERTYLEATGDLSYVSVKNGDDTTTAHTRGLLRYNLSNMTSLGISHDYTRAQISGVGSHDRYNLHQSAAMITHQMGPRLAISLGGSQEDYENDLATTTNSIYTDYDGYSGDLSLAYKLSRMTSLTLSGNMGQRDYKDNKVKDYDFWGGMLGISNRITPRITVGLRGGYTSREYDITYNNNDGENEFIYGADLNIRLSNLSTLNVNYDYGLQDTFYARETTALKTPFDRDAGLLDLLPEDYKYIKTHRINANLAYNLTDKDSLNLGGGLIMSESDQPAAGSASGTNLDEGNYFAGVGLSHRFTRWLALNAGFVYGARTSNVRNKYDYKTYTAGLSLAF